jgi:Family of unknown function (DUF5522)
MSGDGDRSRAAAQAAHDQAVRDGADGYVDPPTGLFVFTSAYLAARGTCCDSGCRHCPYKR